MSDRRAFEHLPYLPIALLQEVLTNSRDEVALVSSTDQSGQATVRVVVRGPNWGPEQRDLTSASFDLVFAKDTSYLVKVSGLVHPDGNPLHFMSHDIVYSNYEAVHSLMLPKTIEERVAGRSINMLSLKSLSVNQGLTESSLN